MTVAALASALEASAAQLARSSTERMLADPFWSARFGARGDRHAHQDGDFHVSYLVQAVRLESVGLLESYALWLRGVLVPRGMCSLHLRANFRLLGDAITRAGIPSPDQALTLLSAASSALVHRDGVASRVEAAASAVALAAASLLDGAPSEARVDELREWLSYLADAIGTGSPALFGRHVAFMESFAGRPGIAPRPVADVLDALAAELQTALEPPAWSEIEGVLRAPAIAAPGRPYAHP